MSDKSKTTALDEPFRCNVGGVADRAEFREMLLGMIDDADVAASDMMAEMRDAIVMLTKRSVAGLSWADQNSTISPLGSTEYSEFVCHTMNLIDPRVRECGNECAWVAPFGWVPEAGCSIHD